MRKNKKNNEFYFLVLGVNFFSFHQWLTPTCQGGWSLHCGMDASKWFFHFFFFWSSISAQQLMVKIG